MKILISFLFVCIVNSLPAQDLYDLNTVQTIKITFAQSNWDQLLDNAYDAGTYTLAETVEINGIVFDSVGVKYKGNSTYNSNQAKNPFHIELDTYKNQNYDGYKDIKLSNVAKDPSYLREVLSYQILRQYMVAPQSNYANVYVNDQLIGLYSNSESITKTFVDKYFGSNSNTFIKCNPPAGAGPQSNDLPSLEYLGQDSSDYYDAYEIKSDYGWEELINLCDTLNNSVDEIEKILDIDKTLWMHAFNNVLVNLDSYSGMFTQNYYLYRDDYGRFLPIVWDLNESIGKFSATGNGNLNGTQAKQQMSHLLHANDADFPLISKLLSNPLYQRMYLAHYKTILLENFDNESYYSTASDLMNLINEHVQADNNNLFSYNDFLNNLDDDIGGGGGGPGGGNATPGIANLMDGRSEYLTGLDIFNQAEPIITDITLASSNPIIGESILISANITNAEAAYLGYRNESGAPFTRLLMNDNGDDTYGIDLVIQGPFTQYYIYAENSNIGKFSPQRAEHEFHSFTSTNTITILGDLVINEFLASNTAGQADQDGEHDDWIEIYNNGSSEIILDGYFLSDDFNELDKWNFPAGTSIAPNSYLIIWADNDEEQEGLHANFKLNAAGESVFLIDATGTILDEVTYIDQSTDTTLGRFPNGTGEFTKMPATFNGENLLTTYNENILDEQLNIKTYPNPANDSFIISINKNDRSDLEIFNVAGKSILKSTITNQLIVESADWDAGIYFIRIGNSFAKVIKN